METSLGSFVVLIRADRAPVTSRAFLALVDDGSFTRHGAFYRTVRKDENDHGHPKIDVIQGGVQQLPASLRRIEHETTDNTGLRHVNGAVSLARGALGSATGAAFFICIGDQPALDAGGDRNGDRQGFAAFGRVIAGMDTVHLIHQSRTRDAAADGPMQGQILEPNIRMARVVRRIHAEPSVQGECARQGAE